MSPENFVYWLNGFVELNGSQPNEQQWESIKDHLQLVMNKKTPVRSIMVDVAPKPWVFTNPKDLQITC